MDFSSREQIKWAGNAHSGGNAHCFNELNFRLVDQSGRQYIKNLHTFGFFA
jgi:hypothetical protein